VRPIARYVLRDGCKTVFFCLHVAVFSRLRLRFLCKAYGSFRQAIALDRMSLGKNRKRIAGWWLRQWLAPGCEVMLGGIP